MKGLPEVLPGRLFSTRMPRNIQHGEAAANFAEKVRMILYLRRHVDVVSAHGQLIVNCLYIGAGI